MTYTPISVALPNETNECPKNKTEWMQRSSILCRQFSDQFYHCLPTISLNQSVEDCLRVVRIQPGFCAFYKNGTVSFDFKSRCKEKPNCPETTYRSNETYLYPLCQEINPSQGCYLADADCQTSSNPTSPTASPGRGGTSCAKKLSPLIWILPKIFGFVGMLMNIFFLSDWLFSFVKCKVCWKNLLVV